MFMIKENLVAHARNVYVDRHVRAFTSFPYDLCAKQKWANSSVMRALIQVRRVNHEFVDLVRTRHW